MLPSCDHLTTGSNTHRAFALLHMFPFLNCKAQAKFISQPTFVPALLSSSASILLRFHQSMNLTLCFRVQYLQRRWITQLKGSSSSRTVQFIINEHLRSLKTLQICLDKRRGILSKTILTSVLIVHTGQVVVSCNGWFLCSLKGKTT